MNCDFKISILNKTNFELHVHFSNRTLLNTQIDSSFLELYNVEILYLIVSKGIWQVVRVLTANLKIYLIFI